MDEEKIISETEVTEDTVNTEAVGETEAAEETAVAEVEETSAEETDGEDIPHYNDQPPAGRILGSLRLIYTEQDIYDVMRIQTYARLPLKIMNIAMMILPVVGIVLGIYNVIQKQENATFNLMIWIALLLFVFYTLCIAPKRNAKTAFAGIDQDQKEGKVSDFTVYEGGVYTDSMYGKQCFEWSEFKEAYECPAGIVLVTRGRGPVFFPERLLEGFDRQRLSEVLQENFDRKYYVCNYK